MTIIHKTFHATNKDAPTTSPPSSYIPPTSSLPASRQRWLTMATDSVDRAGDILLLEGMVAENFLRNPQFLWQHGASGETISTIGKVLELRVGIAGTAGTAEGGSPHALLALVEYAAPELSPLAEQVYQMDVAGMLPANSIGFRPIEYEANEFGGYTFTQWELIECSKVELPMNPEAVDAYRSEIGRPQAAPTPDDAAEWLVSFAPAALAGE